MKFKYIVGLILLLLCSFLNAELTPQNSSWKNERPEKVKQMAEAGNPEAMLRLGDMYAVGYGVTIDAMKSIEWYEKSAKAGNHIAQYWLGNSSIMDGNSEEAFKWFLASAEQGNSLAQFSLAETYMKGEVVSKDIKEAIKWLKLSAGQNYPHAQFLLGKTLLTNSVNSAERDTALIWLEKSLDRQETSYEAEAEYLIGDIYSSGDIVEPDEKKALEWYTRSAGRGYAKAQFKLGTINFSEGGKEKFIEAYKWFILAEDGGEEKAKEAKLVLRAQLNSEELLIAQKKASKFKIRKPDAKSGQVSTGTGCLVSPDGYILTAHHVISEAAKIRVRHMKDLYDAELVSSQEANDIAILKIEGSDFSCLPIKASRRVKLGDSVFTVGFPNISIQGSQPKYTRGEISSLAGVQDNPWNFQISVPVQPGNSGGPLVDAKGNIVGVVISTLAQQRAWQMTGSIPQNVNYAVKSSMVLNFIEASTPALFETAPEPFNSDNQLENPVSYTESAVVTIFASKS